MVSSLKAIRNYQTPSQLRKNSEKDWGLEYTEALEMSYENIQEEAKYALKGVSIIK
ncbi:MAG: hypothetical protein AB9922_12255 [Bacteroidales bacterium]